MPFSFAESNKGFKRYGNMCDAISISVPFGLKATSPYNY